MKKSLLVILIFNAVIVINCFVVYSCKDCVEGGKYNTEWTKLDYDTYVTYKDQTLNKDVHLVTFAITTSHGKIAMATLIPESNAKGGNDGPCADPTYVHADSIVETFISCNRDLLNKNANENCSDLIKVRTSQSSTVLKEALEDLYTSPNSVVKFSLDIDTSILLSKEPHQFTVRLKTKSGKVLEATSDDILIKF